MNKIFQDDELSQKKVNNNWSKEELLDQDGIFFLKDVVKKLHLDPVHVAKEAERLAEMGESPWEIMGIRKIWNHWSIRMRVFAPYYREHLKPKYEPIPKKIDANKLLQKKGTFLLSQVCQHIPFTTYQIRYQVKKDPQGREKFGVWKDEDEKRYVVDMEIFSKWLKTLWHPE